ncbi:hypothetical protein J5N97_016616 [Dioscorea zingiberensis]|uniref:Uncharacterized protein n=1 Tax=Dioscorea zingiberensis TaxID=325984 RepID=A0A9D5CJV4_9LILI|nr:hypothetical protein J5N97_016616 [Dioscorea zingiberensis]
MGFNSANEAIMMEPAVASSQAPMELHQEIVSLKDKLLKKQIDLVEKISAQRNEKLLQNQLQEVTKFCGQRDAERMKLQKGHEMDLDHVQAMQIDTYVKIQKMDSLQQKFLVKLDAFDKHMKGQRRKLIVKQLDARSEERCLRDHWLEEVKAGRLAKTFDELPLSDTGFCLAQFKYSEVDGVGDEGSASELLNSGFFSLKQNADKISTGSMECTDIYGSHTKGSINFTNESAAEIPVEPGTFLSHSCSLGSAAIVQPIETAEIPAVVSHETKCDPTETLPSSSSVTNAASHKLDAVNTNLEAATEVEIPYEVETPYSPLSCINKLPKEFDAIPTRLVTASAVGKSQETETALLPSCDINKPVLEYDSVIRSPQETDGPSMPLVTNIPLPLSSINAVAPNELNEIQTKLVSETRVGKPLETQTPSPSSMKSAAVNELDVITNPEAKSRVDAILEAETVSSSRNDKKVALCEYGPSHTTLGAASGVGEPPESESPSVSTVREVTVKEIDASVTNLDLTTRVGLPHQTKIPCPLDATNAPVSGPDAIDANLGATARVDNELDNVTANLQVTNIVSLPPETKSLCPSDATNSAANGPDAIDTNLETTTRIEMRLRIEPPTSSDVISAAVDKLDAITTSSGGRQLDSQLNQYTYSDSACLTSLPLQSQMEVTSSSQILSVSAFGNPVTSTQVLGTSEQECAIRHGLGTDQELSPLPQINHNLMASGCFQLNHPTFNETEFCDNQVSTSEPGPYQPGFANQDIEEPNIVSSAQFEPSIQLPSQTLVQPIFPPGNIPRENTQSEDPPSISSVSRNILHELQAQLWMHPHSLHSNPFDNELMKISKQNELLIQIHEDKKRKIKLECEKDVESVKRKYEALIQDAEQDYMRGKKVFKELYEKVNNNIDLAVQFRDKFLDNKGRSPVATHGAKMTQQPTNLRPAPASATLAPLPAVSPQLAMRRQDSALPHQRVPYTHAVVFPSCSVRPNFSTALPSRPPPSLQIVREHRLPAPHLQSSRYRPTLSTPRPTIGLQTGSLIGPENT